MSKSSERLSDYWRTAASLPIQPWSVQHWQGDNPQSQADQVVIEEPFELRLNGRSLAVIMRTPGDTVEQDRELALGFLLSEGIITDPPAVVAIRRTRDADGLPEENVLNVELQADISPFDEKADLENTGRFERRFIVASSCGVCGKNSIVETCRHLPPLSVDDGLTVSPAVLYGMPVTLRTAQAVFEQTGGLHAAGLFDRNGQLLLLREDIGRHNAVDKLVGRMALDGQYPLSDQILLLSGRTSFEIIQKALAARIGIVAAVSAPSSLAVQLAEEGGITLVGFLRNQSMNVYTHPSRVRV